MSVPDSIRQLVERFDEHRDSYRAGKYNETQLRREFLDPFFETLGWDVFNKQGYAEAYKDIIHEDSLEVEGATKAPDYSFRIGGTRKFFVEAKKPAVNIEYDIYPAFQLRRYAWSATLSLSELTDFEEFAVYESRSKPDKSDSAATGRVLLLNYKDYLTRWDEIAAIFSREAVLKGSFDQYAEGLKGKKGTTEVDDAFLEEIEGWRDLLARNIAIRNPDLQVRELNYAVQMTIDRIVFLRICEDRGIEREEQLQELLEGDKVYERLCQLFRQADSRYNSGLFHFSEEKGQSSVPDGLTLRLAIDDKVLKEILRALYYPSPYVFREIPTEILGQVYERFLGKVIRLTAGHQAKVEEKPEVRKAGGVYYTPTYIVEYIVKNTVGKLLEDKTPREAANLKILDPACGSGSFLLGAYQYLLDWHIQWYSGHEPEKWAKGKTPAIYQAQGGDYRLTTTEKKRILLNNIHGVDIDAQAVEVTKLSLSLKVLEGESQESIGAQLVLFKERALPDMGKNIQCGNSLIGPDYYEGRQLTMFIAAEERYRVNAFNWQAAFPHVFSMGGFDAVIGNPPYVVLSEGNLSKAELKYLDHYFVSQYRTDLFHVFIQKGINLLRTSGHIGFITPNTWFTLKNSSRLREYVLTNSLVTELVVFSHKVFEDANVHTGLFFAQKGKASKEHQIVIKYFPAYFTPENLLQPPTSCASQSSWLSRSDFVFETRQTGLTGEFVQKIKQTFPRLEEVARASLGCQAYNSSKHTQEQIRNRIFHASKKLSNEYLPELAGSDVGRYFIDRKRGEWIKYGPWLHDYRTMDWLTGPRLLIREIPGKAPYRVCACYVEEIYCNYKTILNVNPSQVTTFSMKYLLGVLNSKLISYLHPLVSDKMIAETFPRLTVRDLKNLPVRPINFSDLAEKAAHDKLVSLVERMLALHKQSARTPQEKEMIRREIESTDRAIDALVYELYGLTEEEIKIVEGK